MPKALACLLLFAAASFADTIVRTRGQATADASASFSVVDNQFTTDVFTSVGAVAPPMNGSASATAIATLNVNLFTTGPVRNGLVKIVDTRSWAIGPEGMGARLDYTLGSLTGSCNPAVCTLFPFLVPVTLGTSFQFNETQDFEADADSAVVGTASGFGTSNLSFQFFEADGLTAVSVFDPPTSAPEPSTSALLALGAAGILYIHVRSESKKLSTGNGGAGSRG